MNDDALTIARWCWPERGYHDWPTTRPGVRARRVDAAGHPDFWDAESWNSVRAAGLVLIERGHAKAYGNALCAALWPDWDDGATDWELYGEDLGTFAAAPLDAHVKAMAAVIRSLP